jgi:hypothetical protein
MKPAMRRSDADAHARQVPAVEQTCAATCSGQTTDRVATFSAEVVQPPEPWGRRRSYDGCDGRSRTAADQAPASEIKLALIQADAV